MSRRAMGACSSYTATVLCVYHSQARMAEASAVSPFTPLGPLDKHAIRSKVNHLTDCLQPT